MKFLVCLYLTVSFISKLETVTFFNENYDGGDDEVWSQTFDHTSQSGCSMKCTMNHCGYFKVEGGKCFIGALGSQTPIKNGIWQTAKYIAKRNTTVNVSANDEPVNVALGKNSSASSEYELFSRSYESSNAVDGNSSGDTFVSGSGDPNAWWMVDLGQVFKVKKIKIVAYNVARAANLKIYVSPTYEKSSDYSDLPLFAEQVEVPSTTENEYEVEDFMSARYVVIQKQDTDYLDMYEVEVYAITD